MELPFEILVLIAEISSETWQKMLAVGSFARWSASEEGTRAYRKAFVLSRIKKEKVIEFICVTERRTTKNERNLYEYRTAETWYLLDQADTWEDFRVPFEWIRAILGVFTSPTPVVLTDGGRKQKKNLYFIDGCVKLAQLFEKAAPKTNYEWYARYSSYTFIPRDERITVDAAGKHNHNQITVAQYDGEKTLRVQIDHFADRIQIENSTKNIFVLLRLARC